MITKKSEKPKKKGDRELRRLLKEKIEAEDYLFLEHARQRLIDRCLLYTDVLAILEGQRKYKQRRNKKKDRYDNGYQDWNYCIEGCTLDGDKIRVIFSFADDLMLVITVIRLK